MRAVWSLGNPSSHCSEERRPRSGFGVIAFRIDEDGSISLAAHLGAAASSELYPLVQAIAVGAGQNMTVESDSLRGPLLFPNLDPIATRAEGLA